MGLADFLYGLFLWFIKFIFNIISSLFLLAGTIVAAYSDYVLGFALYALGILMNIGMEAYNIHELLQRKHILSARFYAGAAISILITAVLGYGFVYLLLQQAPALRRNQLLSLYFTQRAIDVFVLTGFFYTSFQIALKFARIFAVKFYASAR